MGWETSTRKSRLPADWTKRRLRVLRRDNYRCQWRLDNGARCLAPANQVDHVLPGNNHAYENLQALCRAHHAKKSAAEGVAARNQATRARKPERHPGML